MVEQEPGGLKAQEATNGQTSEEAQAKPDFTASFDADGYLRMELNILAAASNPDKFYLLRGYMDSIRDQAIARVAHIRQKAEAERRALIDVSNKNGHRNFLNKIIGR